MLQLQIYKHSTQLRAVMPCAYDVKPAAQACGCGNSLQTTLRLLCRQPVHCWQVQLLLWFDTLQRHLHRHKLGEQARRQCNSA
jgi:hypothetical protein